MTAFDAADEAMSAAIESSFGTQIGFLPRRKSQGSEFTNGSDEPDPDRTALPDFTAIVTWRPNVIGTGALDSPSGTDRGAVESFDCSVDIDIHVFEDPLHPGTFNLPRTGDYFSLAEEYEGNNVVEISRPGDDGSQRLVYYCTVPEDATS